MQRAVEFTHHSKFDSEVLDEGWYNSKTKDLFLRLHSGNMVGYKNVPLTQWGGLLSAASAGKYWNQTIKRNLGQSGDVVLAPEKPKYGIQSGVGGNTSKFTIRAAVTGTIELELDALNSEDAIRKANIMLNSLPLTDGSKVSIKELVQKF